MVSVVTWQPPDPSTDDIPDYLLGSPGPGSPGLPNPRELWLGAQKIAAALAGSEGAAGEAASAPSANRISSRFFRLVALPGPRLGGILDEWWSTGVKNDAVVVDRRLRLESPRGDAGRGWIITGRMRRFTRWHSVPVVVEMWPVYDKWTMMTMTPRVRVFATQRYFRTGQSALDRLTATLAQISARTVVSAPASPRHAGTRVSSPASREKM